jgi:hypothetical protein
MGNKTRGIILGKLGQLQKSITFDACHRNKTFYDGVKRGIKLSKKFIENISSEELLGNKLNSIRKNEILNGDNMFHGVLYNPSGLTAKELLKYLEYVVAHGDGESIVYCSTRPVTMIDCTLNCVLMETVDYK